MSDFKPLTVSDVSAIAQIVKACETGARARYRPNGSEGPEASINLRALTHDGGGFWFNSDGDVRNAYVHTSGIVESWYPLMHLVSAYRNAIDPFDFDAPMLLIDA